MAGDADPEELLAVGRAAEDAGDADAALLAYAAAGDAGDPAGWHRQGRLLRWLGRYDEAVDAWRRSTQVGHTTPDSLASLLADAGQVDEAVAILEAMGDDPDALQGLGEIEQERGRLPEAEVALRRALDAGSDEAYVFLANVLKSDGRPEEARAVLELGAEHGVAGAELQLANDLADDDLQDTRVERLYRSALAHGELDAEHNLGMHLLELGRFDEGIALIERAAARGDELARRALAELS